LPATNCAPGRIGASPPGVAPPAHLRYPTGRILTILEAGMAEHGEVEYATAEGNDLPAHEATYAGFIHFVYVGVMHVTNIVIGLAVGGVNGAWWWALAIFVLATAAALIDFVGRMKAASAIMLVVALLALAGTA
jgi:hypothetical protein